jgi:hypothetical protein
MRLALFSVILGHAVAQPPGGGGGGGGGTIVVSGSASVALSACGTSASTCSTDGSTASTQRFLTYSTTTGIFTGYMLTNQCPSSRSSMAYNGVISAPTGGTPSCVNQTFPAPAYLAPPVALPLRGRIGLAVRGGENIYNSLDAGFTAGQACTITYGTCDAGTDVMMCEARLEYLCGSAQLRRSMFMSDCGGHVPAPNYHYHCHLRCEYNDSTATAGTPHSPLVGLMLDGRGLYGMYESGLTMPTNLDACGGHYGPVPATTINGVTYPAASNVYHYHMQHQAPYVPACFGPVTSLSQAHGLYPTCSSGTPISVCTSSGMYSNYRLDCPPVRMGSDSINQVAVTSACPVCTGNCAGEYYGTGSGGSGSNTGSSTPTAVSLPAGAIAGIVIAAVVGVLVIGAITIQVVRARNQAAVSSSPISAAPPKAVQVAH